MARIKLEIPNTLIAEISIPVRIGDINYGNHVGNDSFVSIVHEARLQWLSNYGFSELNAGDAALIMSDMTFEFKNQAFYGDTIDIKIYAGDISRVGFELYYKLQTVRKGSKVLLANAKTGMICFDYKNQKAVSVPAVVAKMLVSIDIDL